MASRNNRGGMSNQAGGRVVGPSNRTTSKSVATKTKKDAPRGKTGSKLPMADAKREATLRNSIQCRLKPVRKQTLKVGKDFALALTNSERLAADVEHRLRGALGSSRGQASERARQRLNKWTNISAELLAVILDAKDMSQRAIELVAGFQIACIPHMAAANLAGVKTFQATELLRDVQVRTAKLMDKLGRIARDMGDFGRDFSDVKEKAILKQITATKDSITSLVRAPKPLDSAETLVLDNSSIPGLMVSIAILLTKKSVCCVNELIEESGDRAKIAKTLGGTRDVSRTNMFRSFIGVGDMMAADISATEAWIKRNGNSTAQSLRNQHWEYAVHETYDMFGQSLKEFSNSLAVKSQGSKAGGSPLGWLFRIFRK